MAVILIVPMCLLCALIGVWLRGPDNNILVQIGFVVLFGLFLTAVFYAVSRKFAN